MTWTGRVARCGALGLLLTSVLGLQAAPDAGRRVVVHAIVQPRPAVLDALVAARAVDVRWVERGLVVFESAANFTPPPAWGARFVAERDAALQLGILRGSDVSGSNAEALESQHDALPLRVAVVPAQAGDAWILVATAAGWPASLHSCHGGLAVPPHRVDPRTILESGPPAALAPFLAARKAWPARERAVLAAIDADSLQAQLDALTIAPGGGVADRYVYGPDLEPIYATRVQRAMQRSVAGIAGATVTLDSFPMRRCITDTTTCIEYPHNVVAHIPGTVPGTGTFVVCAHLDATGSRDPAWVSAIQAQQAQPTPGAEDNASGVACVLEVLRNVAEGVRGGTVHLPFDVDFIAFSGEEVPSTGTEQGLAGSAAYVRAKTAAGVKLLACLNSDMVGYDHPSMQGVLQVVHNPASLWLAEVAAAAAQTQVPPQLTPVLEVDEARASDHNSFWVRGVPGLLFADATVDSLRRYATYHRPGDLPALVDVSKLVRVSRVLLASLLSFDAPGSDPQLALAPEDVRLIRPIGGVGLTYDPRVHPLSPGLELRVRIDIRNLGGTYAGPLRIQIQSAGTDGERAVFDSSGVVSLQTAGFVEIERVVPILESDEGAREVRVGVTWRDAQGADAILTASKAYTVEGRGLRLQVVNPLRDTAVAALQFDVARGGHFDVGVFDLEGQRLGAWSAELPALTFAASAAARLRALSLAQLTPGGTGSNWTSGVYVVRVRRDGAGGAASMTAPLVITR